MTSIARMCIWKRCCRHIAVIIVNELVKLVSFYKLINYKTAYRSGFIRHMPLPVFGQKQIHHPAIAFYPGGLAVCF